MRCKQLWTVEDIFGTTKSVLETRPIFHKCDETIAGQVMCSLRALLLRKRLHDHLEARSWTLEWEDIVREVDGISQVTVTHGAKRFIIRTEAGGAARFEELPEKV